MRTVLTHCGVILDAEVLGLDVSLDSCITATLTLLFSSTTPSSVSLLAIPLALSCIMLNVLSSLVCSADGVGVGGCDGDDCGHCWVSEA